MKLYEIPSELRAIEVQIAEMEGELTAEIEAQLDDLQAEFSRKVEWLALMIREAEAEAAVFKAEENRLKERRQAAENRGKRLKAYVHENMLRMEAKSVRGDLATVNVVQNSRPSVTWREDVDLPDEFARIKREIDTNAVLVHVGIHGSPPTGAIVETGSHVRIR